VIATYRWPRNCKEQYTCRVTKRAAERRDNEHWPWEHAHRRRDSRVRSKDVTDPLFSVRIRPVIFFPDSVELLRYLGEQVNRGIEFISKIEGFSLNHANSLRQERLGRLPDARWHSFATVRHSGEQTGI